MPLIRGIILIIFGLMMFAWGRGVTSSVRPPSVDTVNEAVRK